MSNQAQLVRVRDLLKRGALCEAETLASGAVTSDPKNADALHLLGLVRKQAGDAAGALELIRSSIERAPARADFRGNLGNLLRSLGRFAEAEAAFRRALGIDASFRAARLGLARVLNDAKRYADSATEARVLIQRNGRDAEAWATLGAALAGIGDESGAEGAYRKALALRPDYSAARHNLGALLSRTQRAEEAIIELDRVASQGLRGREVQFNRARALFDLYRFDEAEQALIEALRVAPRDVESQAFLAKLRYMRGDDRFARSLESALEQFPGDVALRMTLGDLQRLAGLAGQSEGHLRTLIAAGHDTPEIRSALATVLQEQNRFEEALIEAQGAQDARPDNPIFTENLVTLLLCVGRPAQALPLIDRERERAPLDQRWLTHRATAARLLGLPDYERLYDYERFVRPLELQPPPGWSSIAELHGDLIPVLAERHQLKAHPLDQSVRSGTQTARSLLADPHPVIQALLGALRAAVADYRAAIGYDPSHPYLERNRDGAQMVGCWSVRLHRGGHHVNHIHPMGWISSAYYVKAPDEVADMSLRSGWIKFGEPNVATPGVTPCHFVQPREGRLVLFPSYMWHGTTPIFGNEPRITVAFDVAPIPRVRPGNGI